MLLGMYLCYYFLFSKYLIYWSIEGRDFWFQIFAVPYASLSLSHIECLQLQILKAYILSQLTGLTFFQVLTKKIVPKGEK